MRYIDEVRQKFYPVLANQPIPVSEATHLRFGVSTTPTLVLVDPEGGIDSLHVGLIEHAELEKLVEGVGG